MIFENEGGRENRSGYDLVGGEIISSTAVLPEDPKGPNGEISSEAAKERGWLNAMDRAFRKEGLSTPERQANVTEIVEAAIRAGISKDNIKAHLESLGISVVKK